MRFFSTVELVNMLEQEKAAGKAGQIATRLLHADLLILDELGYLPFSASGGALLFHLLSKLYEQTSVIITTSLSFSGWAAIFRDAKMTTALLDRLTHRCHILKTGNDGFRFRNSSATQAQRERKLQPTCWIQTPNLNSPGQLLWQSREEGQQAGRQPRLEKNGCEPAQYVPDRSQSHLAGMIIIQCQLGSEDGE